MLCRSAQGLYWMGRYLERAERLCRLLEVQVEILVDRPTRDIHLGWSRLYDSLGRTPPSGALTLDESDDFTLADAYTLADDLTFERANPTSVWSCFAFGRENARQMRHCISEEMWAQLNLAYLRMQERSILDVWQVSPESFYAETVAEVNTFAGVAYSTMYRDDGWHFMELGRAIERVQFLTSLLLSQVGLISRGEDAESGWISLLQACYALEAYIDRYEVEVSEDKVLDLLVADKRLPASVSRALTLVAEALRQLPPGPLPNCDAAAWSLAEQLASLLEVEWPKQGDRAGLLRQIGDFSRQLHFRITDAYFEYPIDGASDV